MTLKSVLLGSALVALLWTPAEASPLLPLNSTFDPSNVLFNKDGSACTGDTLTQSINLAGDTSCTSLAFTFLWADFNPLTDTVTGGNLTLNFYDDASDLGSGGESVDISLDALMAASGFALTSGTGQTSKSLNVAGQLQNGILNVLLTLGSHNRGNNDFYFSAAALSATGTRAQSTLPPDPLPNDVAPLPEPATLALLSVGLVVAGARLRRRG